jgi:hypothetical protein
MTDLSTRIQLELLADTLGVAAADLGSLSRLGAHDLHTLHERISAALYDADKPAFARIGRLAPLVPNPLAASVALAAIRPEVGGRAGGALGLQYPDRIAGLLAGLTPRYMADAAPFLDPRAIAVLASRIPARILVPAARELLDRGDYRTAARFVEHATDELIRAFDQGISDDVGLLRTAALIFSADRLNEIVAVFPEQRQSAIVTAAVSESDETLVSAVALLARLDGELRQRLAARFIDALDTAGIARMVTIATEFGAIGDLLSALSAVDDTALRRVAGGLAHAEESTIRALAAAADTPLAERTLRDIRLLAVDADISRPAGLIGTR